MIERLKSLPGFDVLSDAALAVIVARSATRSFAPGQLVLSGGEVAGSLLACVEGALIGASGTPAPPVFDAPGLLFGLAVAEDHVAGPDGLTAIAIAKPHVFTVAREFPEFVISLMQSGDRGR